MSGEIHLEDAAEEAEGGDVNVVGVALPLLLLTHVVDIADFVIGGCVLEPAEVASELSVVTGLDRREAKQGEKKDF